MSTKNSNNIKIKALVSKMIADKNAVRSYIKGKTTIQSINQRGIKFAKPI